MRGIICMTWILDLKNLKSLLVQILHIVLEMLHHSRYARDVLFARF